MTRTMDEDWLRSLSWDLPTTLPALLSVLGASAMPPYSQRQALRQLTRRPAYMACPKGLKAEVEKFIGGDKGGGKSAGKGAAKMAKAEALLPVVLKGDKPSSPTGTSAARFGTGSSSPPPDPHRSPWAYSHKPHNTP